MRIRLFALVLLLLPLSLSVRPAQTAQSYSVVFCNYAGKGKIWLAQRYYDVEAASDVVQGWWGLEEDQCSTFAHSLGRFGASTWAWFAYNSNYQWAGSGERRCVDKSTKFLNSNLGRPCAGKELLVGFTQLHVRGGFAPYTVNLGE